MSALARDTSSAAPKVPSVALLSAGKDLLPPILGPFSLSYSGAIANLPQLFRNVKQQHPTFLDTFSSRFIADATSSYFHSFHPLRHLRANKNAADEPNVLSPARTTTTEPVRAASGLASRLGAGNNSRPPSTSSTTTGALAAAAGAAGGGGAPSRSRAGSRHTASSLGGELSTAAHDASSRPQFTTSTPLPAAAGAESRHNYQHPPRSALGNIRDDRGNGGCAAFDHADAVTGARTSRGPPLSPPKANSRRGHVPGQPPRSPPSQRAGASASGLGERASSSSRSATAGTGIAHGGSARGGLDDAATMERPYSAECSTPAVGSTEAAAVTRDRTSAGAGVVRTSAEVQLPSSSAASARPTPAATTASASVGPRTAPATAPLSTVVPGYSPSCLQLCGAA